MGEVKGLFAILTEKEKEIEECEKRGHPNMKELNWGGYVGQYCPDCGYSGNRQLTDTEREKWMGKLYTPLYVRNTD